MATRNGSVFLRDQLSSILLQLNVDDELIISDDHSQDETIEIIQSFNDPRIKLCLHEYSIGLTRNFETTLRLCSGDYIFLADQDDVWIADKIKIMTNYLSEHDLVVCDCLLVDEKLTPKDKSFFRLNNSGKGFIKNFLKNSYMGCCMAFRREVLERALPFPHDIPIHDSWLGLVAEVHYRVKFIPEVLVYHRRHDHNASTTGRMSPLSLRTKLTHRYRIIKNLLFHKAYAG